MAADKGTRKSVPPSRERYEESHPVVSVRISQEMRDELQFLKETAGLSIADLLRIALDKVQPEMEGFFDLGYEESRDTYEVRYCCSGCGVPHLSISTQAEKEAAAQYMYENGWHHPECR